MTDRRLTAARWLLSALFVSLPLTLLLSKRGELRAEEVLAFLAVLSPWLLASVGVVARVPAARGLGIGVGAASLAVWGLAGFPWPDRLGQGVLVAQVGGLVLLLPAFGRAFRDGPRLRWTAAVLAFAIPSAAFFAVMHDGAPQALGWGAVALIALGAIGLAFSRTWALFVLLGAAGVLALTPLAMPPPQLAFTSLAPEPGFAYLAAGVLALTWLPWLGPVFRRLRA